MGVRCNTAVSFPLAIPGLALSSLSDRRPGNVDNSTATRLLGWVRGCVGVDELASAVTEMKKGGARHGHMNPAASNVGKEQSGKV